MPARKFSAPSRKAKAASPRRAPSKANVVDLVLEIGTEELPAAYIPDLVEQLRRDAEEALRAGFLEYRSVWVAATPRRLALVVHGLGDVQRLPAEEIRGPAKSSAYTADGQPTPALTGFVRSRGGSLEQVKTVSVDGKGEYVYLVKPPQSAPTAQVLPQLLAQLVGKLRSPKTMRWDDSGVRFARPVRWILTLYGGRPVRWSFGKLASAPKIVLGGPVHPRAVGVKSLPAYLSLLEKAGILLDHEKRKNKVWSLVTEQAKKAGGRPAPEAVKYGLVDEVNFLTERPAAFIGRFDPKYLALPREVLLASMSKHQRVFAIEDDKGKLTPAFVAILDGVPDKVEGVRRTFERILNARLTDSLFFWSQDHARPFGELGNLEGITFHERLGSMAEKAARLEQLSGTLADAWQLSPAEQKHLRQAASLAKMDLLSALVREFPTLQGTMGKYYALDSQLPREVAVAIEEHYLPLAGRRPQTLVGSALALLDKYDTLAAYFGIGIEPTGDQDPFGLRRAAQGIVEITWLQRRALPFAKVFETWSAAMSVNTARRPQAKVQLTAATAGRVKTYLLERLLGFEWPSADGKPQPPSRDCIEAVLASNCDDLAEAMDRIVSLQQLYGRQDLIKAAKVIERTRNILKGAGAEAAPVDPQRFTEAPERALWDAYTGSRERLAQLVQGREYAKATALYGETLYGPLHEFFAKVMVNDPNADLRRNRLALMKEIQALYTERVADLSKLTIVQHEES